MERRLTLRETQPALGGSEKPPVVDGKIEKVTFSQSVFFFFFPCPQNFVLVKWLADGVTTK